MNWNKIATDYPKAYAAFEAWADKDACSHWCDRDLYDFFDENGIVVSVIFVDKEDCFYSHVESRLKGTVLVLFGKSRIEIETIAFSTSFKILESCISQ